VDGRHALGGNSQVFNHLAPDETRVRKDVNGVREAAAEVAIVVLNAVGGVPLGVQHD
jgi:hypothetical protein